MPAISSVLAQGTAAARPAASTTNASWLYYATDTGILYQSTGSAWTQIAASSALDLLTTKGDLLSRTSSAYSRLGVGSNDQVLTADSTQGSGLKWAAAPGFANPMTTQDDLIVGGASGAPGRLAKGSDGQVLSVDPTTHHLVWATPASGFADPLTTRGDLIVRGAASTGRLALGSSGQYLKSDGTDAVWAAGGSGLYSAYLCYQDQQAQNTDGGTFTSGAWRTRVLNTEVADSGNHGSLASNQVTLDAGTYRVLAHAPAYACDRHQLRLQNITDSTTLVTGSSHYSGTSANSDVVQATLSGRFTLAASKVIEVQHRCQTTEATFGFGVASNFGTEIYTTLELFKE